MHRPFALVSPTDGHPFEISVPFIVRHPKIFLIFHYAAIFKILDARGKAVLHLSLVATKDGRPLLFVEVNVDAEARVPFVRRRHRVRRQACNCNAATREKSNMQADDEKKAGGVVGGWPLAEVKKR